MKFRTLSLLAAMIFLAAPNIPVPLTAQEQQADKKERPRYRVTDLGTLGGTFSQAFGINNNGSVVGYATLSDTAPPPPLHAFLWRKGVMTDLGTLAGLRSGAFSINDNDDVVGFSETSIPDPNGEDFCGFGDLLICLPVVWRDGVISALPTLGGNNGIAVSINDRGQVVGNAETAQKDSSCPPPQVLVTKPAIWENGEPRALPTAPFRNGLVGGNNNKGQVVGNAETCNFSAVRAYLWQNNTVTKMGTLGGGFLAPVAINNEGQATGSYTPAGIDRGFLWQDGLAMDLGSLPGYPVVHGNNINDRGQIVGQACRSSQMQHCTAFLWQNGIKTDLNTVVPASSSLHMYDPAGINSRGEIVGLAIEKITGQLRAFLATPCDEDHADKEGCDDQAEGTSALRGETSQEPRFVIPENIREMLQRRPGFGRFLSSPQNATLSDAAAASRPTVTLSPTSLTFPTQAIGTVSAPKTVTLKNTGTASLTISSIAITGTNVGDFAQTHTCGRSLAAGASCRISVTFKPTASGTRSAALSITDNAPGSPQKVSLSGTGSGGRCTPLGYQCPPQFPPCCPGLVCRYGGLRFFCEPKALENTSNTSSYWDWDRLNANKLR